MPSELDLVTNRHVFENLDEVFVRLNPQDSKPAKPFSLTLDDKVLAYPHPDPEIDVAVVPTEGGSQGFLLCW
jgi:S1-C subfamily serine protease